MPENFHAEIVEDIVHAFPYPASIEDFQFVDDGVVFTWRSCQFKVTESGLVTHSDGNFWAGDDLSILAERLIAKAKMERLNSHSTAVAS